MDFVFSCMVDCVLKLIMVSEIIIFLRSSNLFLRSLGGISTVKTLILCLLYLVIFESSVFGSFRI